MKRFLIMAMTIGLIAGWAATAEAKTGPRNGYQSTRPAHSRTADKAPVRSGTIVTGSVSGLVGGQPLGCEMAPDCRAWLTSGCDQTLTGRDPALLASIEDVGDLADRTPVWLFERSLGAAALVKVQLWRQDCTEIERPRSTRSNQYFPLEIPPSAEWMTITGYTYNPWGVWPPLPRATLTLDWTLTPFRSTDR
ncbi:MAG: hypothetical protein M3290_09005 [Actinomycetota bacterium]|nr:hypothetical protein [Actinomycetota bacterium]